MPWDAGGSARQGRTHVPLSPAAVWNFFGLWPQEVQFMLQSRTQGEAVSALAPAFCYPFDSCLFPKHASLNPLGFSGAGGGVCTYGKATLHGQEQQDGVGPAENKGSWDFSGTGSRGWKKTLGFGLRQEGRHWKDPLLRPAHTRDRGLCVLDTQVDVILCP